MAGLILLAALIGVPLAEIAVFIKVGGAIGLMPTIALVVLTAVIGTVLLRQQGLSTLHRARAELEAQALPVRELFHGACLLFAGALLLTPGFITDGVGFLLLLPPVRELLRRQLVRQIERQGGFHTTYTTHNGGRRDAGPSDATVIDGDYYEVEDGAEPLPPRSDGDNESPWRSS